MKPIGMYIIDAFAEEVFKGNPAAVCLLEEPLSDDLMQAIAMENNLSETAFVLQEGDKYSLRWFTPLVEVDLCGHATLAAAFVLFNFVNEAQKIIVFNTRSGELRVQNNEGLISLNFPAQPAKAAGPQPNILNAFQISPIEVLAGIKNMLVFESEEIIRNIKPDFNLLKNIEGDGVIITAKGNNADFVSRYFCPADGIDEDPVTGSAHTHLIPYWSAKLNKKNLTALQVSKRGGKLYCEDLGDRVKISGRAVLYSKGTIRF